MPPKKNKSIETATVVSLATPKPFNTQRGDLLSVLYELGMDGNVAAAKLYLEFTLKLDGNNPESDSITVEEAMELLGGLTTIVHDV